MQAFVRSNALDLAMEGCLAKPDAEDEQPLRRLFAAVAHATAPAGLAEALTTSVLRLGQVNAFVHRGTM